MMSEKDFLINALNEWCKSFEGIHVRYAYDADTEYHIIEVDPESIRRGNKEYKKAEFVLWKSFIETFPGSDLLISEPSRANNMANCLFDSIKNSCDSLRGDILWVGNCILPVGEDAIPERIIISQTNEYVNNCEYSLAA